jgi:hypothetical protein
MSLSPTEPEPVEGSRSQRRTVRHAARVVAAVVSVVTLAVVGSSGLLDREADPSPDVPDVTVEAPDQEALERISRQPPAAPPARTEPVCQRTGDLTCFRWAEAMDTRFDVIVATGDLLVTTDEHGAPLTARRVSDGQELVAREVETGDVRWRTATPEAFSLFQARMVDGTLIVIGTDHSDIVLDWPPTLVLGLDPNSGEERWRQDAQLYRMSDGEPLGYGGLVIASDDRQSLSELHDNVPDSLLDRAVGYALVGEDGEVWRIDGMDWSACANGARLTDATIVIGTCDDGEVVLARSDGSEVSRTPVTSRGPTYARSMTMRLGPYRFGNEMTPTGWGDVVIADAITGDEVARLQASRPRTNAGMATDPSRQPVGTTPGSSRSPRWLPRGRPPLGALPKEALRPPRTRG